MVPSFVTKGGSLYTMLHRPFPRLESDSGRHMCGRSAGASCPAANTAAGIACPILPSEIRDSDRLSCFLQKMVVAPNFTVGGNIAERHGKNTGGISVEQ